jgi:hypothetical protein
MSLPLTNGEIVIAAATLIGSHLPHGGVRGGGSRNLKNRSARIRRPSRVEQADTGGLQMTQLEDGLCFHNG